MPERVPKYKCLVCGATYEGKDDNEAYEKALECEGIPVEGQIYKIGDTIIVKNDYKIQQSEVIVSIEVEPRKENQEIHRLKYYYRYGLLYMPLYKEEIIVKK